VVLGLSGGIDSAVVCCLAATALGPENVLGVTMPSEYSSRGSVEDSRRLAENLGIEFREVGITEAYHAYLSLLAREFAGRKPDTTEENIQARVRGNILMAVSNKLGHLVLATGNKSELAVGYCTLYGDMSGGLCVLADVPKTTVYALANYINRQRETVPLSTIRKPPSAELRPDQTDQDTLPSYDVLDAIIAGYVDEGLSADQIVAAGHDRKTVEWVIRAVNRNEYKRRQAAPGLKVTSRAFGTGWRMPIAARY
jgi:NAD+ synthase (glutamine-hydrolysing)